MGLVLVGGIIVSVVKWTCIKSMNPRLLYLWWSCSDWKVQFLCCIISISVALEKSLQLYVLMKLWFVLISGRVAGSDQTDRGYSPGRRSKKILGRVYRTELRVWPIRERGQSWSINVLFKEIHQKSFYQLHVFNLYING